MNCWGRCLYGKRIWVASPLEIHAVMVQIALHWNPANPGKALVIPLAHIENVYTLPDAGRPHRPHGAPRGGRHRTGYPCDGVTVRQNNEPAGGQDVCTTHVIPRYIGDGKYRPVRADDRDRARYAGRLRDLLSSTLSKEEWRDSAVA